MFTTTSGHAQFRAAWFRAKLLERMAAVEAEDMQPAMATSSKFVCSRGVAEVVAFQVGTGGLLTADYVVARNERGYPLQDFGSVAQGSTDRSKSQRREPMEKLDRIREVFRPSVTELASALGVSRQAVYKWRAGQPIAERNEARLEELARAAEILRSQGLAGKSSVLRRKLPGGKTLLEAVCAGESPDAATGALIELVVKEQQQGRALSARLAQRARKRIDVNDIGSPYLNEQP